MTPDRRLDWTKAAQVVDKLIEKPRLPGRSLDQTRVAEVMERKITPPVRKGGKPAA